MQSRTKTIEGTERPHRAVVVAVEDVITQQGERVIIIVASSRLDVIRQGAPREV